jgi:conjugative transfer region protein TrbK
LRIGIVDGRALPRIGAFAFVGIAITVAVIETRQHSVSALPATLPTTVVAIDPLRSELARCRSIGQAGASDPDCLQVWEQARRRFLGTGAPATKSQTMPAVAGNPEPAPAIAEAATSVVRTRDVGEP